MKSAEEMLQLFEKSGLENCKAVSKQLIGLDHIKEHYSYGTVIDEDGNEIIWPCEGDGESYYPYFYYLYPATAKFIEAASEFVPYAAKRLIEAEELLKEVFNIEETAIPIGELYEKINKFLGDSKWKPSATTG